MHLGISAVRHACPSFQNTAGVPWIADVEYMKKLEEGSRTVVVHCMYTCVHAEDSTV